MFATPADVGIPVVPTWQASHRDGTLGITASTIDAGPFLAPVPLPTPAGWDAAARAAGSIVLFVGNDLDLAAGHADQHTLFDHLFAAAERGEPAAGIVPYTET
jgi:hypothetical protein